MAKKEKKKWESVPTKAFKSEEDLKKDMLEKKDNKEKPLMVDMSFEELIKLSVSDKTTKKDS